MWVIGGGRPVVWEEGGVKSEEIFSFVDESNAVEHVDAAEKEVVRVHEVIINLRVLACEW